MKTHHRSSSLGRRQPARPTELSGRRALVTGAAGGIGAYISRALVAEGVEVVLSGRNERALTTLRNELRSSGGKAEIVVADLASASGRDTLIDRAEEAIGPLDILVNNAGVETAAAFVRLSPEEIDGLLDVNLKGPMTLMHKVLPRMHGRGAGHIVNIGSLAGYISIPYMQSYCASKGALLRLTHALRAEYIDTGVGLSYVACGYVDGGIYEPIVAAGLKASPLAGVSAPATVAAAVVKAIKTDVPEVIVNPRPVRPMIVLGILLPRVAAWVSRTLGTDAVFGELAAKRGRGLPSAAPTE